MNDENTNHVHDGKKAVTLLDLPVEIILHICSFLNMLTLRGLSLVCKEFNDILKKNAFIWKARINHLPYIINPFLQPANPDELFWKRSCIAIEKHTLLWTLPKEELYAKINNRKINALLLMHAGTTCIASTKNRLFFCTLPSLQKKILHLKELTQIYPDYMKLTDNESIYDLTAIGDTIYGSSDQGVKQWMPFSGRNTSFFQKTYKIFCRSEGCKPGAFRCISSCSERSLFATGSEKKIFVFDSRLGYIHPPISYRSHTRTVIKLAMNSEYILSASEDGTVSVWDLRAGRTMKSITISSGGLPTCVNMQRDWVCVGDSIAKLHLLDLKNDSELVKSYSTKHLKRITGVHMTDGCLITAGSVDSTVKISSLTDPPRVIVKMRPGFRKISRMDYLNDTLAIAGYSRTVTSEVKSYIKVWRPRDTYSTIG